MRSKLKTKAKKSEDKLPISDSVEAVLKNSKSEVIDARNVDNIGLKTIKNLEIEISSSQSDDEALLHQLLNRVQNSK